MVCETLQLRVRVFRDAKVLCCPSIPRRLRLSFFTILHTRMPVVPVLPVFARCRFARPTFEPTSNSITKTPESRPKSLSSVYGVTLLPGAAR